MLIIGLVLGLKIGLNNASFFGYGRPKPLRYSRKAGVRYCNVPVSYVTFVGAMSEWELSE